MLVYAVTRYVFSCVISTHTSFVFYGERAFNRKSQFRDFKFLTRTGFMHMWTWTSKCIRFLLLFRL